jgi:hypothetical protein
MLPDGDFGAGYVGMLWLMGMRYPMSGQVKMVDGLAVDSGAAAMRRGQNVGIVEATDNRIIRMAILSSDQRSLQRYGR